MEAKNNNGISIFSFVFSLGVVLIHCGRLSPFPVVHFVLKSMICRLAVPFFLISAGYFFQKGKVEKPDYEHHYFKKQGKNYLFWSGVYLPFAIAFVKNENIPIWLYPLALLFGLAYFGVYYHLWYFPAVFTGLRWNQWWLKRVSYSTLLLIDFLLYCFGSLETYSSYFEKSTLMNVYEMYAKVFITTRNGLFYAPIFLLLGQGLYDHHQIIFSMVKSKFYLFLLLLTTIVEGIIVYKNPGYDKNFMFFLLLASPYIFGKALLVNIKASKSYYNLQKLGQHIYFLHPASIALLKYYNPELMGFPLFLSVVVVIIILEIIVTRLRFKLPKRYSIKRRE